MECPLEILKCRRRALLAFPKLFLELAKGFEPPTL